MIKTVYTGEQVDYGEPIAGAEFFLKHGLRG